MAVLSPATAGPLASTAPLTSDGSQLLSLTYVGGQLGLLGMGQGDGNDLRLSVYGDGRWSPWRLLGPGGVGFASPVDVGGDLVVLGITFRGRGPTFVDLTNSTNQSMDDYPLLTTFEQGAAWSGSALLVCGGQRPTNSPVNNTDDPSPVSDECAIWRPSPGT